MSASSATRFGTRSGRWPRERPSVRPRGPHRGRDGRDGAARPGLPRGSRGARHAGRELRRRGRCCTRRCSRLPSRCDRAGVDPGCARRGRGRLGRPTRPDQQRRPRLSTRRARRGGRPVRGLSRGLLRLRDGREREGDVPLLPDGRGGDGG